MHLEGHCWVLRASVKTNNTQQFKSQKQPLNLMVSDSCYFLFFSRSYYSHSLDTHSSVVDGYFSYLFSDERIIKLVCSSQPKSYSVNQQLDILEDRASNDHKKFCFLNIKTEVTLWKSPKSK